MFKFYPDLTSPSKFIKLGWNKLKKIPGGNKIFSSIVSKAIPYTGSISPLVLSIDNGKACVLIKDKRAVRNHLNSIHAIALANVGEFSTGLSIISQLSDNTKSILTKIEVEYLKKARGDLIAEAEYRLPKDLINDSEHKVTANIFDTSRNIVAKVHAVWRIRL